MIYFVILLAAIFLMFMVGDDKPNVTIKLEDINVGDMLCIKGETFIVQEYSSNGVMEVKEIGKGPANETYIIKIDDNAIITSHNVNGERKYVSIDNFKGTVGGDYLNKIKFQ